MKEHEKLYRYTYTTLWFNISLPFLYRAQGNQNPNLLLFDSEIEQNSTSNRLYCVHRFRTVISCIIKSISNFLTALMDSLGPLTENTVAAKIIRPPREKNLFFLYLDDESSWKSATFTML